MHLLRAAVDRIEAATRLDLPAVPARAVYVADGRVRLEAGTAAASLGAGSTWFAKGPLALLAPEPAVLVRWELVPPDPPPVGEHAATMLTEPVRLDPERRYLLRADRVDFPPGGIAYRHTHQGPGIRCLIQGGLRVESGGRTIEVEPLGLWFESGPEPVLATASKVAATTFVRVMILSLELKGQSSIRYVDPADRDKPKPQRYQVFLDQPLNP
jgi:quercetin dioxygenase-like cupin family protein